MKTLVVLLLFSTLLFSQTVKVGYVEDSIPHAIAKKVLKLAYEKIGMRVEFIPFHNTESLKKLRSGEIDADACRVKSVIDKFEEYLQVPVHITSIKAVVFSKDKNIKINQWHDLKAYDFTILKETKFIDYATNGMKRTVLTDYKQAFKDLDEGKTQLLVIPKKNGQMFLHELGLKHIHIISPILEEHFLYHVVHKKNRDLVDRLVPVLQKMHDDEHIKFIHSMTHTYR